MLTIFFAIIFLDLASYTLAKNSDFWYNGFMYCEHVYKIMRSDICPKCGWDTHETDWDLVAEQHKDWIASGKAELQGWWSI